MKNAGSLLPILAMVAMTTACKKEELVTPATAAAQATTQASRPDVTGDQVTDPTTTGALQTNGYAYQGEPTAMETGLQASGTLNTNVVGPVTERIRTIPTDDDLTDGGLRPDCSFPLAPGLENQNTNSTK